MNDAQQMDILLQEHLALEEQINLWYSSTNTELQRLAKYLESKSSDLEYITYYKGYDDAIGDRYNHEV